MYCCARSCRAGTRVGVLPARAVVDVDGIQVPGRVLGLLRESSEQQGVGLLIEVPNAPAGLGPGARIPVALLTADRQGLLLPRDALLYDERGAYVYKQLTQEIGRGQGALCGSEGESAAALLGTVGWSKASMTMTTSWCTVRVSCGRCREWAPSSMMTTTTRTNAMLAAIVRASLRNPRIVTALTCLIAALGLAALLAARFDVFPDFAPPHVLVQTEAPGLDATQVEALVTRPLEGLLAGTENVKTVRSTSSQGLSAIQVVFDRGGDPYRQRQVVTERLAEFAGMLPPGVGAPLLSPLSSSMEYLVHFGYTSDRLSPMELRDVVQWMVKPQILAVPGVAQAQIFGGEVRERQIEVDTARLAAAGLDLEDVLAAAKRATGLIGGGYLETPTQRIVIQAQAPGATLDALGQAVVGTRAGQPVRLEDVATLREGAEPRFGDALIAGKPGILIETSTQFGANTLEVTRALELRLDALAPALAKQGVQYHPALLRPASFIESAIDKLRNSLAHWRACSWSHYCCSPCATGAAHWSPSARSRSLC